MFTDGSWPLDPLRTLVHLHASVLGIGADCLVDVRSGTATVADGGRTGTVTAEIDLTTFRSGVRRRDDHVKSADFLDVARHPLATFTASWTGGLPTRLDGELAVHGVTAPVTLQVELVPDGADGIAFRATTQVSRRAFGVTRTRYVLADGVDVVIEGAARHESVAVPDGVYGDAIERTREEPSRDRSGGRGGS